MKPARIELHIEELVLHGFKPGDRHAIGDAVQHELARVVALHGISRSVMSNMRNMDGARIDAGKFQMPADSRAQIIGTRLAHVVYRGLTK